MMLSSRWSAARGHLSNYGPTVVAAGIISSGVNEIIFVVRHRIAYLLIKLINALILRGFRDRVPLTEYGG